MRTHAFFWLWTVAAVIALGRLWSVGQRGSARPDLVDALAAVILAVAVVILGRVLYRLAELDRR